MGTRKDIQPRQSKTVEARHTKTVVPKWELLDSPETGRVRLKGNFVARDGTWNKSLLWEASQAFPKKIVDVVSGDKNEHIYSPRPNLNDFDEKMKYLDRLRAIHDRGEFKTQGSYDKPVEKPKAGTMMERERAKEAIISSLTPKVKATHKEVEIAKYSTPGNKVYQARELKKGHWVNVGGRYLKNEKSEKVPYSPGALKHMRNASEANRLVKIIEDGIRVDPNSRSGGGAVRAAEAARQKLAATLGKISDGNFSRVKYNELKPYTDPKNLTAFPHQKALLEPEKKKVPPKKRPVGPGSRKYKDPTRGKFGDKFDPSRHTLRPNQYVDSNQRIRNMSARQKAQRAAVQQRIKQRQIAEVMRVQASLARRAQAHKMALQHRKERDRARWAAKAPARHRAARLASRQLDHKADALKRHLKGDKNYGRVPLKMLFPAPGNKTDNAARNRMLANATRSQLYPKMRHATHDKSPMLSKMTAPMKRGITIGDPFNREPVNFGIKRVMGGTVFGMETPVSAPKFPDGGRGVFIQINATAALRQLTQTFPAAVRTAIVATSDRIGKKLLDIVEPYVPKDTGMLYSTATSNVGLTSAGLVDVEDGEGYPSDMMYGVSISYNAPYAEIVYFDETKRHGEAYNDYHGTATKGPKETSRWIEAAFREEGAAIAALSAEYAMAVSLAVGAAGGRRTKR